MRVAELIRAGVFRVAERDRPITQPGEVLVRITRVGICGSDVHLFRDGKIGQIVLDQPLIAGHEAVGLVESVSDETHEHLLGRRIALEPAVPCSKCRFCLNGDSNLCPYMNFFGLPPQDGALREYVAHPASLVEPLPEAVTEEEGVLLEPLAIALHAIDLGKIQMGKTVVILGAGVLGLCTLLLVKQLGCEHVIVTDLLNYRLELAKSLGADFALHAERDDLTSVVQQISHGYGADYLFEAAGVSQTQEQMVDAAAPGAKLIVIGSHAEDRVSFCCGTARRKGLSLYMVRRSRHTLQRAMSILLSARLPLRQLATHCDGLEEVQRAFERARNYADGVVKGMIRI